MEDGRFTEHQRNIRLEVVKAGLFVLAMTIICAASGAALAYLTGVVRPEFGAELGAAGGAVGGAIDRANRLIFG